MRLQRAMTRASSAASNRGTRADASLSGGVTVTSSPDRGGGSFRDRNSKGGPGILHTPGGGQGEALGTVPKAESVSAHPASRSGMRGASQRALSESPGEKSSLEKLPWREVIAGGASSEGQDQTRSFSSLSIHEVARIAVGRPHEL